jgi:hypothetical protein
MTLALKPAIPHTFTPCMYLIARTSTKTHFSGKEPLRFAEKQPTTPVKALKRRHRYHKPCMATIIS